MGLNGTSGGFCCDTQGLRTVVWLAAEGGLETLFKGMSFKGHLRTRITAMNICSNPITQCQFSVAPVETSKDHAMPDAKELYAVHLMDPCLMGKGHYR